MSALTFAWFGSPGADNLRGVAEFGVGGARFRMELPSFSHAKDIDALMRAAHKWGVETGERNIKSKLWHALEGSPT
jgi:hypothetical protein